MLHTVSLGKQELPYGRQITREHKVPLQGGAFGLSQVRRAWQVQILKVQLGFAIGSVTLHWQQPQGKGFVPAEALYQKEQQKGNIQFLHILRPLLLLLPTSTMSRKGSSAVRAAWASPPPFCRVPAKRLSIPWCSYSGAVQHFWVSCFWGQNCITAGLWGPHLSLLAGKLKQRGNCVWRALNSPEMRQQVSSRNEPDTVGQHGSSSSHQQLVAPRHQTSTEIRCF